MTEAVQLNAIACENCRSKKCKCDRKIPLCTQCRTSSLPCHYQKGGKRGLPAAYIAALEKRLADTEAALFTTLVTLQTRDTLRLTEGHLSGAMSQTSQPQRSKAEKLEEWKRLPLQTQEQLAAWLQARHPDTSQARPSKPVPEHQAHSTPAASERRSDSNAHRFHEARASTARSAAAVQQLSDCDMPTIPNVPQDSSIQWRENYF